MHSMQDEVQPIQTNDAIGRQPLCSKPNAQVLMTNSASKGFVLPANAAQYLTREICSPVEMIIRLSTDTQDETSAVVRQVR